MSGTTIQWTDKTWNPVTGCTKVSPGCAHCYAEGVAERFWSTQYPKVEFCGEQLPRAREFTDVMEHLNRLDQPLRWRKPSRIFVNSMSDLFHENVSDEFISHVFAIMALTPQHTYQILTKRAQRMRDYVNTMSIDPDAYCFAWASNYERDDLRPTPALKSEAWPLPNVWLGVSVENQHFADERIPLLLETPAAIRFISAEPLLGPVTLRDWPKMFRNDHVGDPTGVAYQSLDWVIVGGESGIGARPFNLDWARTIIEECRVSGVPVFIKQLGRNLYLWKNHKGGDMAEWPEDLRIRDFPATALNRGEGACDGESDLEQL